MRMSRTFALIVAATFLVVSVSAGTRSSRTSVVTTSSGAAPSDLLEEVRKRFPDLFSGSTFGSAGEHTSKTPQGEETVTVSTSPDGTRTVTRVFRGSSSSSGGSFSGFGFGGTSIESTFSPGPVIPVEKPDPVNTGGASVAPSESKPRRRRSSKRKSRKSRKTVVTSTSTGVDLPVEDGSDDVTTSVTVQYEPTDMVPGMPTPIDEEEFVPTPVIKPVPTTGSSAPSSVRVVVSKPERPPVYEPSVSDEEGCSGSEVSVEAVEKCVNAIRANPSTFAPLLPCDIPVYTSRPPFRSSTALRSSALAHTEDMAMRIRGITHTGSDGSTIGMRIWDRAGFVGSPVAENVAVGQRSARDVVFAWMCSKGHRDNIMSCSHDSMGTGIMTNGRIYWTQNFGCTKFNSCTC